MPKNDQCNHSNCFGQPCKSLTDEELAPTLEDREEGRRLVADGWFQTSRRFRGIARIKPEYRIEHLLKSEVAGTSAGLALADLWMRNRMFLVGLPAHSPEFAEHRTVSVRVFKAFRDAGGDSR